jgi:GNAT superfamily N-acetyltransferase
MLSIDGTSVEVRRAALDEIIDLRHAVLREGLPRDAAVFDGDEDPTSRHYAALAGGQVVCCATLHLSSWQAEPAWQLRGMATAPHFQRKGVGRELMDLMEADLRCDAQRPGADAESVPLLLWCNARVPALGFYQGLGWEIVSDRFEIPTAGPHHRMRKRL